MAKKEIFKQYLSDIPVLIEDKSLTSPDYFRITELPSQLTAGKNTIKFTLNTPLFANESIIYVEILDYNEEPVYYEVNIDKESSNKPAIINIFVNQDTCTGNGQIILCSTINKTIDGISLDTSSTNIRWTAPINIDISKRNDNSIIFAKTPEASVTSSYAQVNETSYIDLNIGGAYKTKEQTQTVTLSGGIEPAAIYYNHNNTPILILNEYAYTNPITPQRGFVTSSVNAIINISSSYINELIPNSYNNINIQQFSSSVSSFTGSLNFAESFAAAGTGSHIAYLKNPISYEIEDSNERYYPDEVKLSNINVTYTLSPDNDNLYTFKNATQNTYNSVTVNFKNLTTTTGTIAKIRAYYKSSGLGEYILFNESSISELDAEFGFNVDSLVATYTVPTTHKNEKIDFKFEFVSLSGFVASQTTEVQNTTFIGGNTYVAGEDNLITGSLFVGNATGSGVQISGKNNASMIRSIGYEGFAKAKAGSSPAGFVIYSGSIQPLLNSSEIYSGVGIELYANTASYFKYTTSGSGLLDVRTENFFLGSKNQFISGANGNIEISSSNFHLSPNGNVNMSGDINANTGIFKDVNIIGTIATKDVGTKYLLEPWITGSSYITSASLGKLAKLPLQFTNAGDDGLGNQMQKFKFGSYYWTGSCIFYDYDYDTNTSTPNQSISFTSSISSITGSSFSTYSEGIIPVTFDYSAIGQNSSYPNSGIPKTFAKWGKLTGYDGHEYGIDANGNYVTSSIDSVIFNVVPANNQPLPWNNRPFTLSILSELLNADDINFYDVSSNPTPLQLQLQAKFINNIPNWLYSTSILDDSKGPLAYSCKFTVDIYNGNNVLLLSDSKMQNSEFEWMDFNIPLTALLLKTKTAINSGMGNIYYSNLFRIKLSWQLIKHATPLGYAQAADPKQIRITEARIVHLPNAIGLRASSINFTDSYLASTTDGTTVQGNLIPVDDSLYDLGSSDQNPLLADYTAEIFEGPIISTKSSQKRWNNIYGKFISADSAISIGSGVVLQSTSSLAQGYETITSGIYSHAEGQQTKTGKFRGVINRNNSVDMDAIYNGYPNLPDNFLDGEPDSDTYAYINTSNNTNDLTLNTFNIQTIGYFEGFENSTALRDIVSCAGIHTFTVALTGGSLTGTYVGPDNPVRSVTFSLYYFQYYDGSLDIDTNPLLVPYTEEITSFTQLNDSNGKAAHAEGYGTLAEGQAAHAEGWGAYAKGAGAHAEGYSTRAEGQYSHAEGQNTQALGYSSHAEGHETFASGSYSHAEGYKTIATGSYSHAEGSGSIALAFASHAEGRNTVASGLYQHVQGQFNRSSSIQSAFIHGNGTSNVARSNLIFAAGTEVQITGSLKTTTDLLVNGIDVGRGGSIFSVLMGVDALANNTGGSSNVAIGHQAVFTTTNASGLTAIGRKALYANTFGSANTAVGAFTLQANSTGNNNTAVGREAMASSSLGYQNTAVGRSALFTNTQGNNNTAVGHEALVSSSLGDGNVAVGDEALSMNVLGNGNVAIGYGANTLASGNNNSIVIGSGSKGLGANTTVLGNTSTTLTSLRGQIAIGTTSVNATAQVQIDSTTRGVLLPRMTTAEINAIVSPLKGLIVFNTTLNTLCWYNGVTWQKATTTLM